MFKLIKNLLLDLVVIGLLGLFVFCSYHFVKEYLHYKEGEDTYDEAASNSVVHKEIPAPEKEPPAEQGEEPFPEECPIDIDFDSLKAVNKDVVGWIYMEDSQINYPVLKCDDNDTYVHRMYNGQYNYAGSIFIDCRNTEISKDLFTIMYGHHMKNGSMFANLYYYRTSDDYYSGHKYMWYLTPDRVYRMDVVGGFIDNADSPIYYFPFRLTDVPDKVEYALEKSDFEPSSMIRKDSIYKLALLSTCSYETNSSKERYLVLCSMREVTGR